MGLNMRLKMVNKKPNKEDMRLKMVNKKLRNQIRKT